MLDCVQGCGYLHWHYLQPLGVGIQTTRNILPSKGPAKSMCNRIQGRVGQDQGCNGAVGGEGRSCWHSRHSLTICSISRSMPGHHTRLRARAFILETPGCPPSHSVTQQHTTIVYEELQSPNPKWSQIYVWPCRVRAQRWNWPDACVELPCFIEQGQQGFVIGL